MGLAARVWFRQADSGWKRTAASLWQSAITRKDRPCGRGFSRAAGRKVSLRAEPELPGLHHQDVVVIRRDWIGGSRGGIDVPRLAGGCLDRLQRLQMVSDPLQGSNQVDIALPIVVPAAAEAEGSCDFKINRCNEAIRELDALRARYGSAFRFFSRNRGFALEWLEFGACISISE